MNESTNTQPVSSGSERGMHNAAAIALVVMTLLLPIAFFPSVTIPWGITKGIVLGVGVVFALIALLISMLRRGALEVPRHPIFLAVLALPVVYFVSAALSGTFSHSLVGQGFEVTTFFAVLMGALLAVMIPLSFRKSGYLTKLYDAVFVSFILLALFQLLRLIIGPEFLSFGVLTSNVSNLVGKWNDLGIFAGLVAILSLISLDVVADKYRKMLVIAALALSLAFLAVVNFTLAWILVGIFSLLFFIFTFSFSILRGKSSGNASSVVSSVPVAPLIVFIFSLLFVIAQGPLGSILSDVFDVSQVEVRPSWSATFEVGIDSIQENPLFGVGPNNFQKQWLMYKPAEINSTIFWNSDFNSGIGLIPSTPVTVGLLGLLAWLALLGLMLWLGIKTIGRDQAQKPVHMYLEISSFLASVYLWVFFIFYIPSIVLFILAFIFMGVFFAVQVQKGSISMLRVSAFGSPRQAFVVTFVTVVLLIGAVGWGYLLATRYIAAGYYQSGLVASARGGEIDVVERRIGRAVNLYQNDDYFRSLSQVYLVRLNQVVSQEGVSEDILRSQFQTILGGAIDSARRAIAIDERDYQNWLSLGQVYAAITPLEIEGAYDNALSAYNEAHALNPQSPAIDLLKARLELAQNNVESAREKIESALVKKPNYTEAVFLLSQVEAQQGNVDAAIQAAQSAAVLSPNDYTVYFQLGLLYYNQENWQNAVGALERSVILFPTYSNAKYFLGLAYEQLGRSEDAIAQFEDLVLLNPDNEEVQLILDNLKEGLDPFAGAQPPLDESPEDRDTLPLEEEEDVE